MNDFLVAANAYHRDNPTQRLGQAYFNVLWDTDEPLARRVRGTVLDPFYQDSRVGDFLAFIAMRWADDE